MSKKPIKNQFFTEHDDGSITFNSNLIVSDTPRTDAAKEGGESWMELAALSAQLERENAALREDKARLDWLCEDDGSVWLYNYLRVTRCLCRKDIDAARNGVQP